MYEAGSSAADLDLAAAARGIRIAAVNERHPDVASSLFSGRSLSGSSRMAGSARGARVALVCDNPFGPFLKIGLGQSGIASVALFSLGAAIYGGAQPGRRRDRARPNLSPRCSATRMFAGWSMVKRLSAVVQFWGDIDRPPRSTWGFGPVWPVIEPRPGHMGILLDALGPRADRPASGWWSARGGDDRPRRARDTWRHRAMRLSNAELCALKGLRGCPLPGLTACEPV